MHMHIYARKSHAHIPCTAAMKTDSLEWIAILVKLTKMMDGWPVALL